MRFKKTVMTGALALSVIVGAGAAYASPASANNGTASNISDCYGMSLQDLLKSLPQGNSTIVWPGMSFYMPDTGYGSGDNGNGGNYYGGGYGYDGSDSGAGTGADVNNGGGAGTGTDNGTGTGNGAGTGAGAGTGTGTGTGTTDTASAYADQVVSLVNQERAKAGLAPLTSDPALANMALDKAKDMYNNNYFDHNSPTYGSPFDMMSAYGISYSYAGENIAKGQRNPQEVMDAWMNSTGHRENILNSNYTKIGVAYYNGEWVQEFIAN